jgi:hypothetical protein
MQTSSKTETFLTSCYAANSEPGKQEVQTFAQKIMLPGGQVKANKLQGMAALPPSALQQIVNGYQNAYNTFWMPRSTVPVQLVVNAITGAIARDAQNQEAKQRGLGEIPVGESTIYDYQVPQ